jgi:hypothetical protein
MFASELYRGHVIARVAFSMQPFKPLRGDIMDRSPNGLFRRGSIENSNELSILGQAHRFFPRVDRVLELALPLERIAKCFIDGGVLGIKFSAFRYC